MADFDFLEATKASSFKVFKGIALNSLYISSGYDVTSYFRSAANCINVFLSGRVRVAISRYLETVIQVLHIPFCNLLSILFIDPENGAQVGLLSSTPCISQMADIDFLINYYG